MFCLNFFLFSVVGIKLMDRNNLKKGGFILAHTSRVQSIIVGKLSWQELEAAGHIAFTMRKQQAMAVHYCSVPLIHAYSPGSQSGNGSTDRQWVFLHQSQNNPTETCPEKRPFSQAILHPTLATLLTTYCKCHFIALSSSSFLVTTHSIFSLAYRYVLDLDAFFILPNQMLYNRIDLVAASNPL